MKLDRNEKLGYSIKLDQNVIIDGILALKSKHKFTNYFFKKYLNESHIKIMLINSLEPFIGELVNDISDFIELGFSIENKNVKITFEVLNFFKHNINFESEEARNNWLVKLDNIEKVTLENIFNQIEQLKLESGIISIVEDFVIREIDGLIDKQKSLPKTKEEFEILEDKILIDLYGINANTIKKDMYKIGDVAEVKSEG